MEKGYNGWKNYETWNVALWIGNDEKLYNLAIFCKNYETFKENVHSSETGDGVSWDDSELDTEALDEMITETW